MNAVSRDPCIRRSDLRRAGEIPIPGTEMVITKEEQLKRIQAYAAREGIELVAVYGDSEPVENFAERAGVKAMFNVIPRFSFASANDSFSPFRIAGYEM